MHSCIFCQIAAGEAPADVIHEWDDAVAIVPLAPVTPGHWIVIPKVHVADATSEPTVTAAVMERASELAAEVGSQYNLITSVGSDATQTVFHLHIHLVPRAAGDGLPLPWTPQQRRLAEERAAADRRARRAARPTSVRVVYAYEDLPDDSATTVFLAGPTPRSSDVESWRPAAIAELTRQWDGPGELVILVPEPRDGQWAADYTQQYDWEQRAMEAADVILFWVPRGPGMEARTTNIEWGFYVKSGRAVLGAPPEAPWARYNRYLIHQAGMYGAPVAETLAGTVREALTLAG